MQTGSSKTLIWKSGKTSRGPNEGNVAMAGFYFLHKQTHWPPAAFASAIMAGEEQPQAADVNFATAVAVRIFLQTRQPSVP